MVTGRRLGCSGIFINLLEISVSHKGCARVDVGNFPAILHNGPLPPLSYGGSTPLTNEKLIRTETLKVIATVEGWKARDAIFNRSRLGGLFEKASTVL